MSTTSKGSEITELVPYKSLKNVSTVIVTLTEEGLCYDVSKSEVFKSNLASCNI